MLGFKTCFTGSLTADVDDLTGTANDDTFSAPLTVAGTQTLQNFDTIEAGEGTDTLNATLLGNAAPTLDSVEVINARAINAATLDLTNAEGVEQVWSDRAQANLTVSNVGEVVTVGAKDIAANAAHTTNIQYTAGTVAATATQAIALENANLTLDIEQAGANLDSVRNVSIASAGEANVVDFENQDLLANANVQNLTITGAGNLEIAAANAITAGTVDASAATGDLELTVADAAAGNLATGVTARTVTLGSGDDTLNVAGATLASNVVEGGEGTDTLVVDGTSATLVNDLVANVSGFEVLNLAGLDQAVSAATFRNVGFETLVITDAAAGSVTNLTADSDVTLVDADGGNTQDTITLAVTGAANDDAASFGFTVAGDDGSDSNYAVTIADVENVTVTTTNADADVYQQTTLAITSAELENLTITGDEAAVFDGTGNAALESVDASGLTVEDVTAGNFAATLTVGDGVSVTGSAGDDSITFGDQSVVAGGEGEDLFVLASNGSETQFGTISDFGADDTIQFGVAVTSITQIEEADLGLAPGVDATFANYIAAATGAGTTGDVSYFAFDGDTYLVQDGNGAAGGFSAGTDQIVKLTGAVDLSELEVNATTNTQVEIA